MPIEAEVLTVTRSGESVNMTISFTDNNIEVGRESITFSPSQVVDENLIRQRINDIGAKISTYLASESFAKSQVGRKFVVVPTPPSPPGNVGLGPKA